MSVIPLRDIKLVLPLIHAVALAGEHRASLGRPRFDDTLAPPHSGGRWSKAAYNRFPG